MQGLQTVAVRHKKNVIGLHLDILALQVQDFAQINRHLIPHSGIGIFSKNDRFLDFAVFVVPPARESIFSIVIRSRSFSIR